MNNEEMNKEETAALTAVTAPKGLPMPKRVGAVLDATYCEKLNDILDAQHRAFSDWLKRAIDLDWRDLSRQGAY